MALGTTGRSPGPVAMRSISYRSPEGSALPGHKVFGTDRTIWERHHAGGMTSMAQAEAQKL